MAQEGGTCASQLAVVKEACAMARTVKKRCRVNRNSITGNSNTSEAAAGNQISAQEKVCQEELAESKQYCKAQRENANQRCDEEKKIAEETKKMAEESKASSEAAAKKAADEKKVAEEVRERAIAVRDSTEDAKTRQSASNTAEQKHQEAINKMNQENAAREDAAYMEGIRAKEAARMQQIASIMAQIQELANGGTRTAEEARIESEANEFTGDQLKSNFGSAGDSATSQARKSADTSGNPGSNSGQAGSGSPSNQSSNSQGNQSQDQAGGAGSGLGGLGSLLGGNSSSSTPLAPAAAKEDCYNPATASSNPVCTCRLNPTDSRCASILAADKQSQAAKKASAMYSGDEAGGGKGFSTAGGGYKTPEEKNISQMGQLAQGAGGSVGKGVGSGVGNHEANDPRKPQAKPTRDQFSSKRGGSYGGSGGGSGGSSFSASNQNQPNMKFPATFAEANLGKRQALNPRNRAEEIKAQMQARFNARQRSPTSAIGPDGITGPHTDQFKKIRVRYTELLGL